MGEGGQGIRTTGADVLVDTLLANGVDVCFANPGTSEMHFVAALDRKPELRCILGLSEGLVTGAADGYARMAGRPAATLLHTGPGLSNGLANLHNARRARAAVVNIVGDHASHHLPLDAPLTTDIESLAAPMSNWVRRVKDPADVGPTVAAAVQAAWIKLDVAQCGYCQAGQIMQAAALLKVQPSFGPERAMRYNGFLSADINGGPAPGFSSGQAQAAIERIAAETLPPGIGYEWTDLTYQQILAGNSGILVFPLALLLVYLVLAAQYESLTLPIAIILIVPMGIMAALVGVWLTGGDNNVFTQIGLIVLVGLSAKNAILIVEFARELELSGSTPVKAAIEASRLRLRPILMTSMAFIMGVVPLVISTGAGAEMRSAMGVAVFAGMIGVTAFGIFMTPVFYVLIRKLAGERPLKHTGAQIEAPHLAPGE